MNKIVESFEAVRYIYIYIYILKEKWGFVQQSDARRCFK